MQTRFLPLLRRFVPLLVGRLSAVKRISSKLKRFKPSCRVRPIFSRKLKDFIYLALYSLLRSGIIVFSYSQFLKAMQLSHSDPAAFPFTAGLMVLLLLEVLHILNQLWEREERIWERDCYSLVIWGARGGILLMCILTWMFLSL